MPINQNLIMLQEDRAAGSRQQTSYATITAVPTSSGGSSGQASYSGTAPSASDYVSQNSVTFSFSSPISLVENEYLTLTLSTKSTTNTQVSLEVLGLSLTNCGLQGTASRTLTVSSDWSSPITLSYKVLRTLSNVSKLVFTMTTKTHSPLVYIRIDSLERAS